MELSYAPVTWQLALQHVTGADCGVSASQASLLRFNSLAAQLRDYVFHLEDLIPCQTAFAIPYQP